MTPQGETFRAATADLRDHIEAHGCVRCQALLLTMIDAGIEAVEKYYPEDNDRETYLWAIGVKDRQLSDYLDLIYDQGKQIAVKDAEINQLRRERDEARR
jgi:hypothetical protein